MNVVGFYSMFLTSPLPEMPLWRITILLLTDGWKEMFKLQLVTTITIAGTTLLSASLATMRIITVDRVP